MALNTVQKLYGDQHGGDVTLFIQHYQQTVERYVVGDNEVDKLCRELWRNHRKVLEQLMQYGMGRREWILEEIKVLLEEGADWVVLSKTKSEVVFAPQAWEPLLSLRKSETPLLAFAFSVDTDCKATLYMRLTPQVEERLGKNLWDYFSQQNNKPRVYGSTKSWSPLVEPVFQDFQTQAGDSDDDRKEFLKEQLKAVLNNCERAIKDITFFVSNSVHQEQALIVE